MSALFRQGRSGRRLLSGAVSVLLVGSLTAIAVTTSPANADTSSLPVVQDFEAANIITTANPGILPFGSNATDTPKLAIGDAAGRPGAASGSHALDVPYTVSSYGGFSDDLATAQDWSGYGGFSFWVHGGGTGQKVEYEIKDGGTDGEHSELWQAFFSDDFAGWQQIQTPFSSFVKRTDYQPGGAPSDGVLDLTSMWGFAVNLPQSSGDLQFDDVTLYGQAAPQVSAAGTTYLVDAGSSARVGVTLTARGGKPTTSAVTVHWTLGGAGDTAVAGTDYPGGQSGTLTFPAGTVSATRTFVVHTTARSKPSLAKTITVDLTAAGADVTGTAPTIVINAHGFAYLDKTRSVSARVADLMSRMTLADKVGQMTQAERGAVGTGADIASYRLGSLLSGGGSVPTPNTPKSWADMIDGFQRQALGTPLQIPLIYGIDAVHGDNNLAGATLFPHNVGMGATRNPALAVQEGKITATETRATGVPWTFAPCVCVARDERWGRNYESYGEDPALVSRMAVAIKGLQGDGHLARKTSVLATAKHFVGDGGTKYGSSTTGSYPIDQGVTYVTEQQLNKLFLPPFKAAIKDGVGSVMPSYSSLQILGKDAAPVKMHGRKDMITGVLKNKLGFQGFVISDWQGIDQLPGDYLSDVETSINAGIDMVMVPYDYKTFVADLTTLVNGGQVAKARVDDAVRRILTQKFRLGLFDHPFADRTNLNTIGSKQHRAVARRAAAQSQVLLKNAHRALPLAKTGKIYVAGSNADNPGNQSGGWTLTWQGQSGAIPGATSILAGMRQDAPKATVTYSADASAPTTGYKLGVVVVGETPYAEGVGDVGNGHTLQLSVADRDAVDRVCGAMKCVVLVVSGRPLDITGIVGEADAVVASWLPGSEGEGVADVLFGRTPFTGRLPETWAMAESQLPINVGDKRYDPLYPYGWGLRTDSDRARLISLRAALRRTSDGATAVRALDVVLRRSNWTSSGAVAKPATVLRGLTRVAAHMHGTAGGYAGKNLLVSVARDLAQTAVVRGGEAAMTATAATTADAEHALMSGNAVNALTLLKRARVVAPAAAEQAKARAAKAAGAATPIARR